MKRISFRIEPGLLEVLERLPPVHLPDLITEEIDYRYSIGGVPRSQKSATLVLPDDVWAAVKLDYEEEGPQCLMNRLLGMALSRRFS